MYFDKRKCLDRAKLLLRKHDEDALRYACLELRCCIESIAYEKLRTYAKRLPTAMLETWQPPQAFKALLEFEPVADQDFSLRFCEEDANGEPIGAWQSLGTHKTFRLSWLRKKYNALGSHLHVPSPSISGGRGKSGTRKSTLEKLVEEVIQTLEPIVETAMDCSIAKVIEFHCSECNYLIVRNLEGLEKKLCATCLNPNCRAEYRATKNDQTQEFEFALIASTFACMVCGGSILVENRKLKIGCVFECPECNAKHKVLQKKWGYTLNKEEAAAD